MNTSQRVQRFRYKVKINEKTKKKESQEEDSPILCVRESWKRRRDRCAGAFAVGRSKASPNAVAGKMSEKLILLPHQSLKDTTDPLSRVSYTYICSCETNAYPFSFNCLHCPEQKLQFFDCYAVARQDSEHVDQQICKVNVLWERFCASVSRGFSFSRTLMRFNYVFAWRLIK